MNTEFVVKVLLCHPTPSILEEPEVKEAKLSIKKRYRELSRSADFTSAEIQAKKEWLESYLQNIIR